MKTLLKLTVAALAMTVGTAATAEMSLSVYTGYQSAPHSNVSGTDPAGAGDFDFLAGWEGLPFQMPPHYGFRLMSWKASGWGFGVDFNHNKVYANSATLGTGGTSGGFEVLEFTDGLNTLTLNAAKRWTLGNTNWMPYVGAGVGVAIPHVEVRTESGAPTTFEYQFGGPAVMLNAGAAYRLNDDWSLFGEYKGTYNMLDVDLVGGGNLKTNIITNAFNVGITRHF